MEEDIKPKRNLIKVAIVFSVTAIVAVFVVMILMNISLGGKNTYAIRLTGVYFDNEVISNADKDSFEIFNSNYAKDKNNAYIEGDIILSADANSFQVIDLVYAKDKKNVYKFGKIMPGENPNTFKVTIQNYEEEQFTAGLKPVIYLYPTQTQKVQVQLDYQGKLIADYPTYDYSIKGWEVIANPDGTIINQAGKKEYSYLFWEGIPTNPVNWDLSKGFVIKGEDTQEFLQSTLSKIGLTPKEYNEFIVYWYPKMKDNKFNLIHFADEQYTKTAPLDIIPKPDSMLRVFMVFKPLKEKIEIQSQEIKPFERKGFAVVEWGGSEIR